MDGSESTASPSLRGRPRSEQARDAVLHAADDLLVELGYEALTMKGIAERAGVGRQTVYRWWASKAEILFEACAFDIVQELAFSAIESPRELLSTWIDRLVVFLGDSDAGATYLALLGAAQADRAVASQLQASDPLRHSAGRVVEALRAAGGNIPETEVALSQLVGPLVFAALSMRDPIRLALASHQVDSLVAAWSL